MSRIKRNHSLENREARTKLKPRNAPYWTVLDPGLALGYRRGTRGGVWSARRLTDGKYVFKTLGVADDYHDSDMSYRQAQRAAWEWYEAPQVSVRDFTVAKAVQKYPEDYHGKSRTRLEQTINAHIVGPLGKVRTAELTSEKIHQWRLAVAKSAPRRRGKLGAPPSDPEAVRRRRATSNRVLAILKAVLNHSWRAGMIASADAWNKVRPMKGVESSRVRYLTHAECGRLLNAAPADLRAIIRAALLTGCRYGEVRALQVCDCNPDAGTVHVRAEVSKTGKARQVPLTEEGRAFFDRATAGKTGSALILTRADGLPWGPSHQARPMRDACAAAGVDPPASFHILRHTYASLLAVRGVPLQVIAAALGHSDTRVTEQHYAHLMPSYVADTIRENLPDFGTPSENVVKL